MKNLKFKVFALSIFYLLTLVSCDKDDTSSNNQSTSKLTIKLVDEPGDFEHVYLDVVDVRVKINDDTNDDNWQSLEAINTGIYDLLDLTGGVNVLLADKYEIPSGKLNQIRLVLGDNNTVVIDGETFPLRTPGSTQSGLKIKVNETLEPNVEYVFYLDFNVEESIVMAGNSGNIILKPVIRATSEISKGNIGGNVLPIGVQTLVSIKLDDKTVISTYVDVDGNFLLVGVPAGNYDVTFAPDSDSEYKETVVENVVVVVGQTTIIETVNL